MGSDTPASMRREGFAMLQAISQDISQIPGCSVVTTLERGFPAELAGEVIQVANAADENAVFQRLLRETDAVHVIAPETDGILAERCRQVQVAGTASWNCSPHAIELCGDKLRLADHLQARGLPTISTALASLARPDNEETWPRVLKPRDGAGSCFTFLVRDENEWEQAAHSFHEAGIADKCLVQPFISGRALSIGINVSLDGRRMECLPVGEQHLSNDGRFHYLGGSIPAGIPSATSEAIRSLALAACRAIQGLAGYIGIDVLLTDQGDPVIVEINPRLTTSYVGYRRLYSQPLPNFWLSSIDTLPHTNWRTIQFK